MLLNPIFSYSTELSSSHPIFVLFSFFIRRFFLFVHKRQNSFGNVFLRPNVPLHSKAPETWTRREFFITFKFLEDISILWTIGLLCGVEMLRSKQNPLNASQIYELSVFYSIAGCFVGQTDSNFPFVQIHRWDFELYWSLPNIFHFYTFVMLKI